MQCLAPLARPFFQWNHDVIMRWGENGLETNSLSTRIAISLSTFLEFFRAVQHCLDLPIRVGKMVVGLDDQPVLFLRGAILTRANSPRIFNPKNVKTKFPFSY